MFFAAPGHLLARGLVVARGRGAGARRIHARHKEKLDADKAFAFADRTAPLVTLKGEAAGIIAPGGRSAFPRRACAHYDRRARCTSRGLSAAYDRWASDRRRRGA